jgi:hypothetical protein
VRATRQAEALSPVLAVLPAFSSAPEIHAELRRRGEQVLYLVFVRLLGWLALLTWADASK